MQSIMGALFGPGHAAESDPEAQALLRNAQQARVDTEVVKSTAARVVHKTGSVNGDEAPGAAQHAPSPRAHSARESAGGARGTAGGAGGGPATSHATSAALTVAYGLTNLGSVVSIVVANKMVLFVHKFSFVVTLTLLHSIFTAVGMALFAAAGLFEVKKIAAWHSFQLASVYVGFIVSNNLSIQLNPLGFYQLSKLAITPVVVIIEYFAYKKTVSYRVIAAIALLMVGITLCSVTDAQVSSNLPGVLAAIAAVLVASLYQVWAGTKQKELGINGMQLLQQVSPVSVLLLTVLIPIMEPVGWSDPKPGTILGYTFTPKATMWIVISSALGLVVTLSTFLFIGATSSLTYNVVGHLKTILIVAAGVAFFKEDIGLKKAAGLVVALTGIVWYTQIKMEEARKPGPGDSKG